MKTDTKHIPCRVVEFMPGYFILRRTDGSATFPTTIGPFATVAEAIRFTERTESDWRWDGSTDVNQ